jgi:hypothetical protein
MGRVPMELIEKILVHADLEIPESLRRPLPRQCTVRVGHTYFEKCWENRVEDDYDFQAPPPSSLPTRPSCKRRKLDGVWPAKSSCHTF